MFNECVEVAVATEQAVAVGDAAGRNEVSIVLRTVMLLRLAHEVYPPGQAYTGCMGLDGTGRAAGLSLIGDGAGPFGAG